MTTYSTSDEPVVLAVVEAFGPLVDRDVASRTGKDSGWFFQPEADNTTTVERRFTEKRGNTYSPLTYAFQVMPDGSVQPMNRTAENLLATPLDG